MNTRSARAPEPAVAAEGLIRIGVFGLCLALAVAAVFSGLDRASVVQPSLSRFVIWPFAVHAKAAEGQALIASGKSSEAIKLASALVALAPVEPDSTAVLGGARLGAGDLPGAERAFLVAGQLGWRTPLTQFYWMQQALDAGDYRVASLRLDAILRATPSLVGNHGLMDLMESSDQGRAALAERLAGKPGWLIDYTRDVSEISEPVALVRADVLESLARQGIVLGCAQAGFLAQRLVNLGHAPRAFSVWRSHCPERADGLLTDPDFAHLQVHQPDSPFDWSVLGDSEVSISVQPNPGRAPQLRLASSAMFPRKVITQLAMIPPGLYRLSWRAVTDAGSTSRQVAATVSCAADSRDWLTPAQSGADQRMFVDIAVANDCAAHWLGFAILPGGDPLLLGEIRLQPRG